MSSTKTRGGPVGRCKGPSLIAASAVKGRVTRKPFVQPVDLNPQSYARNDPFNAFNALRKLIVSLPSRVGGCQYKLTAEEHKLSTHLLTLVEPFLSMIPSPRPITRQPTEILDAIMFHVDDKKDLVSFSLSCHRLHEIISPRHLEYRVIRCKVSSISVWNHLIVNRSLARNVRELVILDERSASKEQVPPGIMSSDTDLESTDDELELHDKQERYLVSALTRMTALRSFVWNCNHLPITIDNIWPTLLKCQSLANIELSDNLVFSNFGATREDGERQKPRRQVVLPHLQKVALKSTKHTYGSTTTPSMTRINGMLHACPNLKSLEIDYDRRRGGAHPLADDLFLYNIWSGLTSLSLSNLRCTSALTTTAFLFQHPRIEVLHLDIGAAPLALPQGTFSHLRELRGPKNVVAAVLSSGSPLLETLKCTSVFTTEGTSNVALLSSLRSTPSVRRLELAGWGEMDDVKRVVDCIPKVQWLDLGKRVISSSPESRDREKEKEGKHGGLNTNFVEWADLLARLPELATFHGVRLFYEVNLAAVAATATSSISASDRSRAKKNDEIASTIGSGNPKLRRVDHWEEGGGKVIVLLRDKEGVRYEVRRVKI